jgi:hypothetical protein
MITKNSIWLDQPNFEPKVQALKLAKESDRNLCLIDAEANTFQLFLYQPNHGPQRSSLITIHVPYLLSGRATKAHVELQIPSLGGQLTSPGQ